MPVKMPVVHGPNETPLKMSLVVAALPSSPTMNNWLPNTHYLTQTCWPAARPGWLLLTVWMH